MTILLNIVILVAGLGSVKVSTAQPLKPPPPPGPSSLRSPQAPVAPDFEARLDAFLKAWLTDRNAGKTMSFFDRAAYSAPPFIGTYCGGWYKTSASPQDAARFMSQNLMGVPSDFPKQTGAPAIFKAWNRLPAPWVSEAANDVARDHFLVAELDSDSLRRIFSGVFASSDYHKFLQSQIQKSGSAYWVVFPEVAPDGDLFVIFTLWQKTGGPWKITHMDVICQ